MLLAFWPVWRWYALRVSDGSDEPCGLLALATLGVVLLRERARLPNETQRWCCAAAFLAGYVLTYQSLSPLPRALFAVGAVGAVVVPKRNAIAPAALLLLSLPVIATVQFYLGFPLRLLAAEASERTLRALRYGVTREGSLLHWRGETIMVDAPCSGVHMLWVGLYLAASLAAFLRLSNVRSCLLLVGSIAVVVAANVLRATALFFKETGILSLPDWTHAGIGVLIFAGSALLIVRMTGEKLENKWGV